VADEKTDGETTEETAVDESAEKIQKLETEVSEWKDKYMRLAAEYDNYRKRTANEKLSLYDDATAKAVAELLPVADSMQMALANLKDADPEILKGIELVSNQLDKSFEKLKVSGYGEVGDTFDPNIHNAISKVESEELGENTIAGVFQKGYKIGEKIIRHAMVQVANCD
jgi:molecular chaperone GrpE